MLHTIVQVDDELSGFGTHAAYPKSLPLAGGAISSKISKNLASEAHKTLWLTAFDISSGRVGCSACLRIAQASGARIGIDEVVLPSDCASGLDPPVGVVCCARAETQYQRDCQNGRRK